MDNKIILGVLVISFLTSSAYAKSKQQPAPQHQVTIDDMVAKMKAQLELTDQQAQEVKPIIEDYLAKQKQLKLEEKKQLGRVLTGDQLYAWNFLQNEPPPEKKKHAL